MKIVVNRCFGGFGLSDYAKLWLQTNGYQDDPYDIPRHHPLLVKCVEELGKQANTRNSSLCVFEVEDKYYLDYNDGFEEVVTPESLMKRIETENWVSVNANP